MKLSEEDVKLFYKLDWGLMYYANQKYKIIKDIRSPDFKGADLKNVSRLKNKIFENPNVIDGFVSENPLNFGADDLEILKGWKNFVSDKFFVYQHMKDYSIFLQGDKEPKAYGVVGISNSFEEMIPFTPVMLETVLLPFKGRIIYNGLFAPYNITFGGGIKRSLKEDYGRAKALYGIITTLEQASKENTDKDAELVRFYVQNRDNPEYRQALIKLLDKKPELNNVYTFDTGKKCARNYRKNLRYLSVRPCWFAIFFDTIIASGESEQEALERAKKLLPESEAPGIYVFKHEGRLYEANNKH